MSNLHVIIAGGGIGGLAAALALHRQGMRVSVYERAPELREVGAGLTLWANALRALGHLGLLETLLAAGVPEGTGGIRTAAGQLLLAMDTRDFERRLGLPTLAVHRADLLTALRDALPPDVIHLNAPCAGFTQDATGVAVQFANRSTVEGDVLIGADGLHSVVRTRLWGASKPRYAGYTGWRAITKFDHSRLPVGETWGCGARFGIIPMSQGRVYWFATKNASEGERDGLMGRKQDLLDRFGSWHAPIGELIVATDEAAILRNDIYDRPPLRQWGQGCVTLLGDAAHPMTPNLGQGACQALEDAVVLSACLDPTTEVATALRQYEVQRMRRTTAIVRESRLIGAVGQWSNTWLCGFRNAAVRVTPHWMAMRQFGWLLAEQG